MNDGRLVYSTDGGAVGDGSAQSRPKRPGRRKAKGAPTVVVPDDGVVRIFRGRAQGGGKPLTVVRGLPERGAALDARAAELKRLCGAGGSVRGDAIEIQGDHRQRIADHLQTAGYRVKLAGG